MHMTTTNLAARNLAGVTIRRTFSGVALIMFPALLVLDELIDPTSGGTGAVMYEAATEHRGALLGAAAAMIISGLVMIPAVVAIVRQTRDRGARLANFGGVFGVLGATGHVCIGLFYVISAALQGGDKAQMIAFIDRLNDSAALGLSVMPMLVGFSLGVLLLSWAAFRAGLIAIWGPVVATLAVLQHLILPSDFAGGHINTLGLVGLTAVFGYLGSRALTMSDHAWAGAPR
jgi:hypothetical protein